MTRAVYSILYFICLLALPWWLVIILGLTGVVIFPKYWEAVICAFVYDWTYDLPHTGWLLTQFNFTIIFILIFLFVEGYKRNLIFYHSSKLP